MVVIETEGLNLDPLMQEEFLALVAEERERGCAVLLSSHELDEVERVCDGVGIVREGRLIAVERVDDLLAIELAIVLALTALLACLGSVVADAHLSFGSALAGCANVWPLALLFAGVTVAAIALAALGAWLFERRDLAG